ncbi:helix-turn-helix domain-containing protein [Streptomyces lichenis]|uniref:DUF2690 domain-containing protein n=1 Tax=Streptomyces lichenis TaxID=2306967 RepID=A0ABT0I794_9ACTN|nr:XRE family transcriptional regulator [Streptomyces lichenis]MCK8677194.1 DUF2690 domain-containing protein [Streptomyces lichenis]
MPRWKPLPEELDPQVKEFTSQLRRLVDRGGLGVAAVADRTGYSKTSWERYLNGRLLPPKGAVLALAEVTGTNPIHLTTMWELAERAWSRAEMRHDMTMEAIRISQARAALGDFGGGTGAPAPATDRPGDRPTGPAPAATPSPGPRPAHGSVIPADGGPNGPAPRGPGRNTTDAPQPRTQEAEGPAGPARRRSRLPLIASAAAAVVAVAAGAYFLIGQGGEDAGTGKTVAGPPTSAAPSTSAPVKLPPGVKCSGKDCTGQDAQQMGCGGEYATTAATATVGTARIEVRYSKVCGAAWARITQAAGGDTVTVSAAGTTEQRSVKAGGTDTYTAMVAAASADASKACATLAAGGQDCTDGAPGAQ